MGKWLNQQVYMIPLSVTFHQPASKITTDPLKVELQPLIDLFGKDFPSVFCHEDQVKVKVIYNMSSDT
jgi:hypothetical protein